MGARLGKLLFFTAVLWCGVTTATASVGSIISSFQTRQITYPPESTVGIYRDAEYVYIVVYDSFSYYFYSYRYRPDGTSAAGVWFYGPPGYWPPSGADHSVLGPGYVAFPFWDGALVTYSLSTGSLVKSERHMNFDYYAYIPAGDYIYTQEERLVYRLTTAWNVVNSFPVTGRLGAATREFNGCSGEYIISADYPDSALVYTGDGSFVASFGVLSTSFDATCGPGYPASYGTTYWGLFKTSSYYVWCYQIDLGATTNVVPASLGKIKAIYR